MAVGCFHSQAVAEGLLRRAGSRQVWPGLFSGAEAQELFGGLPQICFWRTRSNKGQA